MSATMTSRARTARTPRTGRSRSEDTSPKLRVVAEPRPRHTLTYALVIIVLLGAAVFGAVTLNALAAAEAVQARSLEAQVAEAERSYSSLVAEVAALEDPGRIREAAQELGLVPSGPARHLALNRNLPADGAVVEATLPETASDPVKPVLSAER